MKESISLNQVMTALNNMGKKFKLEPHEDEMITLRISTKKADVLMGWDENDEAELVWIESEPKEVR